MSGATSAQRCAHGKLTCPACIKRIAELEAEVARLREALGDVMGDDPLSICARVHHPKQDRHTAFEECPVARRYLAMLRPEDIEREEQRGDP